jgi:methylglutaconyl-CoA hydratase
MAWRQCWRELRTRGFLTQLRSTLDAIAALSIPTISAINGAALGGGLELALATTFRVAAAPARLGLPETRLGIVPGAGGTRRLPALVGRQRALNLILTGRVVAGLDAEGWGLVDRLVVPRGGEGDAEVRRRTVEEAVSLAELVCAGGPVAIEQALKAVRGWDVPGVEEDAYEVVLKTDDRLQALKAFRDKKAPQFTGR